MNIDLIRAYFKAYRARITDLEADVDNLDYSLNEAQSCQSRLSRDLKNAESEFDSQMREEKSERWALEDRIKKVEQQSRY